jgi:hypothetical protein
MSTWGLNPELIRWEYFVDFSADMVYYSAGIEIPDPAIIHEIRLLFEDFQIAQTMVSSILEFVDMLGGRASGARRSYDALVKRKTGAEALYIEQDYAGCQQELSNMFEEMNSLNEAAMRAKDAAFLWIYLTEWSAITATTMISGYILYVVMVRRKLYSEVSSTRAE